jgi:hypothetical protein
MAWVHSTKSLTGFQQLWKTGLKICDKVALPKSAGKKMAGDASRRFETTDFHCVSLCQKKYFIAAYKYLIVVV